MRIGVLLGGDSSEREVSLKSGNCIASAIESLGHEAIKIDPRHIDITLQGFFNLDKVFIALHGGMGESGHIQALLDLLKIPYTGSGLLASATSLNKSKTKEVWKSHGLKTADWIQVNKHTPTESIKNSLADLTYPVVVKPLNQGCSIGITKADNPEQLFDALIKAFEYDDNILVETFITGREYTCAILDGQPLPSVQIKSDTFFDWDAKFGKQTATYHCPSDLTAEQEEKMQQAALKAYQVLGCRGWGRVDTFLDDEGEVHLIEMNTVPGMTTRSVFPMAAKEVGLSFEDTIAKLLDAASYDEVN
ncbi:D-alanine--D-alanine ligase [Photobacterium sanctipauli]|uniref:D-alanine--D-alanine ligase n=1 Tax=Photobacterium sanctipauli TaxID=1342794 RepID=A0A2T3NP07_9GAMM|nr:D-alanine--D-alanine ligase [Photobacterium sanctipauli]PSW18000.1 D-alanine--D-alanine ligase [Photobacterium sanctipauli]